MCKSCFVRSNRVCKTCGYDGRPISDTVWVFLLTSAVLNMVYTYSPTWMEWLRVLLPLVSLGAAWYSPSLGFEVAYWSAVFMGNKPHNLVRLIPIVHRLFFQKEALIRLCEEHGIVEVTCTDWDVCVNSLKNPLPLDEILQGLYNIRHHPRYRTLSYYHLWMPFTVSKIRQETDPNVRWVLAPGFDQPMTYKCWLLFMFHCIMWVYRITSLIF